MPLVPETLLYSKSKLVTVVPKIAKFWLAPLMVNRRSVTFMALLR